MSTSKKVSEKSCAGLSRREVANLLQPVIELHGIEVKDDRFEFPSVCSCAGISKSELPDDTKKTAVLYKDIASISPFEPRLEVLLQCGELYVFSTTDSVRTHINTYKSHNDTISPKSETTAKNIADNIWNSLDKTLSKDEK